MATPKYDSPLEERSNVSLHAVGLVLSVKALVLLLKQNWP